MPLYCYHVCSNGEGLQTVCQKYEFYSMFQRVTSLDYKMILQCKQCVPLHTINLNRSKITSISSNRCNQPLDSAELATTTPNMSVDDRVESEKNWCKRIVTDINDNVHVYKIIPTCPLSPITCPGTYTGQSELSTECYNMENQRQYQQTTL
jgi:hypothetical protein